MLEADDRRGREREETLPQSVYFDNAYFELTQLFSLAHQIHGIHEMCPTSILEIGIGNGFVSDFFRKSGVPVITADINPALKPDIVAPIKELPQRMAGKRVDVVVCCEVLEHISLKELPKNIEVLRSLGDRLFLTLPNNRKSFGLSGILRFPKMRPKPWSFSFDLPRKKPLPPEHFWEIGHSTASSEATVLRELRKHYGSVKAGRFTLNRYHRFYVAAA
ncbi:class I SAM-dependent methyltransferase [Sphingomonas koreensis]|nr:class I SAM-dependent methyltransferase [Sphingomonas koreensis]